MQAFGNPYGHTFYPCTSPYCLALRDASSHPPNSSCTSTVSTSASSTSPSKPNLPSFSISSILSRSDEQTSKEEQTRESHNSPGAKTPNGSISATFHPSGMSLGRYQPYHHRALATLSAFSQVSHCPVTQLGEPSKIFVKVTIYTVIEPLY